CRVQAATLTFTSGSQDIEVSVEVIVGDAGRVIRVLDFVFCPACQQCAGTGVGGASAKVNVVDLATRYQFESLVTHDVNCYGSTVDLVPFRVIRGCCVDNDRTGVSVEDHVLQV